MRTISNETARNFLVNYQYLNDAENIKGYESAKKFMKRVRLIQFDPLNVVGRNPDLVLQSRVEDYRPEILEGLLYNERFLIDDMLYAIREAFERFSHYLGVEMMKDKYLHKFLTID